MRLVGPVFFKELIALSRRRRHFAVRAAFVGAILLAIGWRGLVIPHPWYYAPGGGLIDYATQVGRAVFQIVITFQFWAIVVVVPAVAATVVASEKERDTFSLLLLTSQRPLRVLLDKLLSRLYYVGLLLLAGLPLLLGLLAFGGVTPEEVLAAYLVLIAAVAWCAGIGLICSAWCHTVTGAVLLAFLLLPITHFAVTWAGERLGDAALLVDTGGIMLASLSPYSGFEMRSTYAEQAWWRSLALGQAAGVRALTLVGACSALWGIAFLLAAVLVSWWLLPYRLARRRQSFLRRYFAEVDQVCRRVRGVWGKELLADRPLGRQPVLWHETSKRFFASNGFLIRSSCLLVGIGGLMIWLVADSSSGGPGGCLDLWAGLILIVAAVLAARAFTAERERHTLAVLLSTPITGRAVYLGKLAGVAKSLSVFLLIPAGLSFVMVAGWYRQNGWWLLAWTPLVLVVLGHVIVTGLNASLCRRRMLTTVLQTGLSLAAQWLSLGAWAGMTYRAHAARVASQLASSGMGWRADTEQPNLATAPLAVLRVLTTGYATRMDWYCGFVRPDHRIPTILLMIVLPLLLALVFRVYLATRSFDRVTGRF